MEFGRKPLGQDRRFYLFRLPIYAALFLIGVCGTHAQDIEFQTDFSDGGPFARMSMILVKSLLFVQVDVLDLEIRFGEETAQRLESAAKGRDLTLSLAEDIAQIATHSQDAAIQLHFLKDVAIDRFIEGAVRNTKLVHKAGLIDAKTYEQIARKLPYWYSSLETRGIKKNDQMFYRIRGDEIRALYRGFDGEIFVDQFNRGEQQRLALIGAYFASESEFREDLIQSLFAHQGARETGFKQDRSQ